VKVKKGDIVVRISYGKDIIFIVDKVLKNIDNNDFAILKGIEVRVEADSPLSDLEAINGVEAKRAIKNIDNRLDERAKDYLLSKNENNFRKEDIYTGKILHLDGDRRYSEKSIRLYKKLGLNAIVKNVPEYKQPDVIISLLNRYNPDILVITGHDAMLRDGTNYNNIYNYRNSKYFINTVIEARKWGKTSNKLTIFARCVPEFF